MGFTTTNNKPAYRIFDSKGKEVSYDKAFKSAKKADMVFFGELHNNPIAHWLQLQVTKDLYKNKKNKLVLGAEMFESDNQLILEEYLQGVISDKKFESECRLWDNYKTDYKPLVEFAKVNELKFIATNVPRRYANVTYKGGLKAAENLSDEAKKYIAPLPIKTDLTVSCYKEMLEMGGGNENFPHAQMIKDATMAHFILKNYEKGNQFLHYNGSFHSDRHEGIIWYINEMSEADLDIQTITTVEQTDIDKLDEKYFGKANFIIVVPEDMTKTY
ncbi:MAG: putative iron-regulated protein [Cognaticolwellia sp.]|jgi:uncharacterized iron-regulated protein